MKRDERILFKKIIFTGGGSAGHVTLNLELIPKFIDEHWEVHYIGSKNGIEKQLLSKIDAVKYYGISTGKLRRYLDFNNLKDPFKVMKGIYESYRIIKKVKPDVIFSKGGFVSVPVVLAGWLNNIPIIIHESDLTPGLANRVAIPFATKVCTTFPDTNKLVNTNRLFYVGPIVKGELKKGESSRGFEICKFTNNKPVILVMGGSQGSLVINKIIRENLDILLNGFQIVHICGIGQVDHQINVNGYVQFEYVNEELPDLLKITDLVISRAGSNSIFEFLSMNIPMILIPLPKKASRGDQLVNARWFEQMGYCEILLEEDLSSQALVELIDKVHKDRFKYIEKMKEKGATFSSDDLFDFIKKYAK